MPFNYTKIIDEEAGQILTPPFRTLYPALFEKAEYEGQERYQVEALFHPEESLEQMERLVITIANARFSKSSKLKMPIRNGDEMTNPLYHGLKFARFKSVYEVSVRDENGNPLKDPNRIYNGCWGRAMIRIASFDKPASKGVTCYLMAYQLLYTATIADLYQSEIDDSRIANILLNDEMFQDEFAKPPALTDSSIMQDGDI